MIAWIDANMEWLFSGAGVAAISAALATISAVVVFIWKRWCRVTPQDVHSGGAGGNAEVIGSGEARGGRGGNSGPFGPGGKGGDARVRGRGKAVGGTGGNGG